ncbi:hypothetical protein [Paenibacillus aceris]|uniref:Uncharacterized protein n=1 Tax=Paenibacillus aceris TaxID=869555 RepID=A0ABS4HUP8_9BACL|nr:hypothetical protein [Paenibacillus aceris]MBP1962353.1 hypothetical protein [Paenibacillus aceris]
MIYIAAVEAGSSLRSATMFFIAVRGEFPRPSVQQNTATMIYIAAVEAGSSLRSATMLFIAVCGSTRDSAYSRTPQR